MHKMVHKISPSTAVLPILHRAHRLLPTSISSWNVYCFCQENTSLTHTQLVTYHRLQMPFWEIISSPIVHFLNLCNFSYLPRLIAFVPQHVLCFLDEFSIRQDPNPLFQHARNSSNNQTEPDLDSYRMLPGKPILTAAIDTYSIGTVIYLVKTQLHSSCTQTTSP